MNFNIAFWQIDWTTNTTESMPTAPQTETRTTDPNQTTNQPYVTEELWGQWTEIDLNTSSENNNPTSNPTSIMGITCTEEMLRLGQCKLNVYDTLGIRKTVRNEGDPTSVGLFVQDIVLSATFFIGTVVTIALIVSWLMYIFAAASGKDPANAKKGIVGALIGLLLVVSSYIIIRLIQYIAKGF